MDIPLEASFEEAAEPFRISSEQNVAHDITLQFRAAASGMYKLERI